MARMTNVAKMWLDFGDNHMTPDLRHGEFWLMENQYNENYWTPAECAIGAMAEGYTKIGRRTGWFIRLSAGVLMDRTDWDGPFKRPSAAAASLLELYAEDYPEPSGGTYAKWAGSIGG